jgi:Beta propeller domain
MILATNVYEYNETDNTSSDSTALISLRLGERSATPQAIGKIKGYILQSYSLDVVKNTLRIASTVQTSYFFPETLIAQESNSSGQGVTGAVVDPAVVQTEARTENYITVLSLPEGNANDTGTMLVLGQLKIGKPQEVITSARFFDNIAYAGTFQYRDPFYVLDLSDDSAPKVLSALDITGFSSTLHSISDDNTLILAIGQDYNANGTEQLGLTLTVFDMSGVKDGKNATIAQKLNIETSAYTSSYADAEWDYKSARYVENRLIIPMDINTYYYNETTQQGSYEGQNFRGFKVYIANADTIQEECSIPHGPQTDPVYPGGPVKIFTDGSGTVANGSIMPVDGVASTGSNGTGSDVFSMPPSDCVYCNYASLARRSFVFNGDLMTTSGSEVKFTDLANCSLKWKQEIVIDTNQTCCDFYPYYY